MLRAIVISWLLTVAAHTPEASYGEFTPQVKSFLEAGLSVGVKPYMENVNLHFMGELPNNWVGMCNMVSHDIYILETIWVAATDEQKENLVWHELGHCALGRYHKENIEDNHPTSLMYHSIRPSDDSDYYRTHRKEYIAELFK